MLSQFTNLFPVIKTLRFELKPIGATTQTIQKNQILERDTQRANSYHLMKATLDKRLNDFNERHLSIIQLEDLPAFYEAYTALKDVTDEKTKTAIKAHLLKSRINYRKKIATTFSASPEFDGLFEAKTIKEPLQNWINAQENPDEYYYDKELHNFMGIFGNYHLIRKNLYSSDAKHSAIAYRIVDQNLPRFIDNVDLLKNIQTNHPELFTTLSQHFSTHFSDYFKGVNTLVDFMQIDTFNHLLTQKALDSYQAVIGGIKTPDSTIQGLNVLINLYNQQHPKNKAGKLKSLYKQLLSLSESASFIPKSFMDDKQTIDSINAYFQTILLDTTIAELDNSPLLSAQSLITSLNRYETDKIYISTPATLNHISQQIYGDYGLIARALDMYYLEHINPAFDQKLAKAKSENARETLLKSKANWIKQPHSIEQINQAMALFNNHTENQVSIVTPIEHYYANLNIVDNNGVSHDLATSIDFIYQQAESLLSMPRESGEKQLLQDKAKFGLIKKLMDTTKIYVNALRDLLPKNTEGLHLDPIFYEKLDSIYSVLSPIHNLYDATRNYLTQKPYQTNKLKLNFDCTELFSGWDKNVIEAKRGALLAKNGKYFVAILDKNHKKSLSDLPKSSSDDYYELYNMRSSQNAFKALPKSAFAKAFLKNERIFDMAQQCRLKDKDGNSIGRHLRKSPNFDLAFMHSVIDHFKNFIKHNREYDVFNFTFKPTQAYQDINEFYADFDKKTLVTWFEKVDTSIINELVADGKIYLFQIYSKDFSEYTKGSHNQQTLLFKHLFSKENMSNPCIKLNGEAEIFYRPLSIDKEKAVVHAKGEKLINKNPLRQGERVASYDITKDKRYTEDKFLFHVPITINYNAPDIKPKQLNQSVLNAIRTNQTPLHIIGVDRGERNLLNFTIINDKGEIVHQESLNTIKHDSYQIHTDYHQLLHAKEKSRADSRVNWLEIENIKDLKQGYLSQVVYRIAKLMIEYNAVVVLEDLNADFKRGRLKIEKQVYQNFEKALIQKLNYLFFKDKMAGEIGSITKAYQLTTPFESFQKLGKQSGFLFYVSARNTSHIDPMTGFVDIHHFKYDNLEQGMDIIENIQFIRYNNQANYFEFSIDYADFTNKAEGTQTHWTICSHSQQRYVLDKQANMGRGGTKAIDVNAELKALFVSHGIDYKEGDDLRPQLRMKSNKDLISRLIYLLNVLTQLRYTNTSTQSDYILSPVMNKQGVFFDSRQASDSQPADGDSNGSYHIALKGLLLMNRVKDWQGDNFDKFDLLVRKKDWLAFSQSRNGF